MNINNRNEHKTDDNGTDQAIFISLVSFSLRTFH